MNRPAKPILTDGETELMQILWEHGPSSAGRIREILRAQGIRRSDSALRKTLGVMEEKGAISHCIENRAYVYSPLIPREQAEKKALCYLSRLFFRGSIAAMALRAIDEADLTPEMIQEIRKRLAEKES